MTAKVRWGVLSTAKIALKQVIPAMQQGQHIEITAIASRDADKAQQAAKELGIAKHYTNYEDLLADPDIDAIYNPLPNHLHVEYTIKALQAGKHVLCEKPIGLDAKQAQHLLNTAAQYPHLMDIGCYCISFPRFIFGAEPKQAISLIDHDPAMKTDRLTSGMLDFGKGKSALFTCSTQLEPYQRVNIFGTKGRLEIEVPVNAPPDVSAKMWLQVNKHIEEISVGHFNQYTIQGTEFSKAILNNTAVPTPLTDALNNMKVIDAIFKSAEQKAWIKC